MDSHPDQVRQSGLNASGLARPGSIELWISVAVGQISGKYHKDFAVNFLRMMI